MKSYLALLSRGANCQCHFEYYRKWINHGVRGHILLDVLDIIFQIATDIYFNPVDHTRARRAPKEISWGMGKGYIQSYMQKYQRGEMRETEAPEWSIVGRDIRSIAQLTCAMIP